MFLICIYCHFLVRCYNYLLLLFIIIIIYQRRGNFDTASSLVRSIGGSYDQWKDTVSYEIFEAPLLGGKDMTFEERIPRIQNLAQTMKHGNAVVQVPIRTIDQLNTKLATIEAENGEGLM